MPISAKETHLAGPTVGTHAGAHLTAIPDKINHLKTAKTANVVEEIMLQTNVISRRLCGFIVIKSVMPYQHAIGNNFPSKNDLLEISIP